MTPDDRAARGADDHEIFTRPKDFLCQPRHDGAAGRLNDQIKAGIKSCNR